MLEINYKSPLRLIEDEWEKLEPSEKSLCLNYAKQLMSKTRPSRKMVSAISWIHKKYEDFHLGCIPCEKAAQKQDEYTQGDLA